MVSGTGTIGPPNRMLALPGRIRVMGMAPAASLGILRTPACRIKYGPTRFSKSSASLRATHLLQDLDLHHDRALAGRLARSCSSYDLKQPGRLKSNALAGRPQRPTNTIQTFCEHFRVHTHADTKMVRHFEKPAGNG